MNYMMEQIKDYITNITTTVNSKTKIMQLQFPVTKDMHNVQDIRSQQSIF